MKAADITIGEDYEVRDGGITYRATVTAIGKKTRRVYSGEPWDTAGHEWTGTHVTISHDGHTRDVVPRSVVRPWVDAEPDPVVAANLRNATRAACAALCIVGLRATPVHNRQGLISLEPVTLAEAEELVLRLATGARS